MLSNTKKKVVALLTALLFTSVLLLPVLTACNNGSQDEGYTYNEYISQFPSTWNTHNGTTDADSYIQGYTEIGLYDFTLSDDRSTYAFIDEMATGDPVNVTSQYASDTKWGITAEQAADTTRGRAWQINLNPDATWENGEAITADDYVWSMERVLSPDMKNSAAASYITGDYAIYNAYNYYSYGSTMEYFQIHEDSYTDAEINEMIANEELYLSLTNGIVYTGFSFSLDRYHELQPQYYYKDMDTSGVDYYEKMESAVQNDLNASGYILITEDNLSVIQECLSVLYENIAFALDENFHWYSPLFISAPANAVYTQIHEDSYTDTELNNLIANEELYLSLTNGIVYTGFSFSLDQYHELQPQYYYKDMDTSGVDYYEKMESAVQNDINAYGYILVTEDNLSVIQECLSVLYENIAFALDENFHWYSPLATISYEESEETPFSNVGIFKTSDTSFVLVFENALTQWQVKYLLTDNWIVYRPYYEDGYSLQGDLTVTNYGTTSGKYMSYGPYRLVNYQVDREIRFERNTNWYGYNAEATNYHAGQFQTDRIVCQVIENQATALLEFTSGNLDSVRLTSNDMSTYRFSDYLMTRSASNSWTITFNSDLEALGRIENSDSARGNRRILSITEFRKALSLSLDRAYIGSNILAGSAAAYSFINNNYYYDMENDPNSIYRNSEQAMSAIVRLYGIEYGADKTYKTLEEAYRAVSGYDIDQAKANFQTAYDKATDQGIYTDGQNIQINIYNNSVTTQLTALESYMQRQVDLATEGTPLADKITITFRARQSGRYDDISNGNIEAIYYSYSGDYNDPNGMLGQYADPDEAQYMLEYGFNPTRETFSITCDFDGDGDEETETNTYQYWYQSTTASGDYANASTDVKLTIMSELEYQLLSGFRSMPLVVGTDLTLRSKKVNYATNTSNIFAMYGGVRLMTYNYNDAEWAEFIRNSSNLDYT